MADDPSPPPASAAAAARGRRVQAVDRAVGRRLRERRLELGLTQQQAAELVGMIPQQLQKYETGANRIYVGRLHRIAETFGVEVGHFFEEIDPEGLLGGAGPDEARRGQRRRLLELVRHAAAIGEPKHREALCRLARDLAALETENPEDAQVEQPSDQPGHQTDRRR
jgi:transcriptional regulator with XRE-family HTH domain